MHSSSAKSRHPERPGNGPGTTGETGGVALRGSNRRQGNQRGITGSPAPVPVTPPIDQEEIIAARALQLIDGGYVRRMSFRCMAIGVVIGLVVAFASHEIMPHRF